MYMCIRIRICIYVHVYVYVYVYVCVDVYVYVQYMCMYRVKMTPRSRSGGRFYRRARHNILARRVYIYLGRARLYIWARHVNILARHEINAIDAKI